MSIDYRERPVSELEKFTVNDADKKREVLYDDACKESEVLNVSEPFCTHDVTKVDNIKDLAQRKVLLSKSLFNSSRFRSEKRDDPINAVKVFYDTYPGMLYRVVPETAVIAAFLSKTKYIRLRYVDVAFVLNPEGNTNQKVAQKQNFDLYPLNAGQTREFVDYDYYKWKTRNVTYEEDEEDQVYLAKSVSVQANNAVTRQFSIRFYDVDSLARALNYLWRFIAKRMSVPPGEDKPCGYDEAEAKKYDVAFQTWSLAVANLTRYVNEFCSQPVFTSTAATLYANRYAYSCVEGDPYVFDNIVRDIALVNKNVSQPLFKYGSDKNKGPSPKVYLTRPLELFAKGTTYLAYLGDKNDSQKDWEDAQPLATVVTLYAWRFAVDGYFEYSDSSDDSYARFVPEHFYVTLSSHPRYSRSDYGKVYDDDVNNVRIGYPTVFEFGLRYDVQYNAKTTNYDFRNPQIDASEFQERGLRASGLNPLKLRVRYSRQPIYCGLASLFYSSDQDWYRPANSFAYMSRTADQRPGRSLVSSASLAKTYDVDPDPDEANSTPKYRVKVMMRLFLYLYYNRLANTQASRPYTLGLLLASMTGYDNEIDEEHRRVLYDAIMTDNMNYRYRLCLDANAQGTPNDDCSPYPDKDRFTTYSEYYIGPDNAIYVYDYSKKVAEVLELENPILERTNIVGKPNYLADLDESYFRLVQGGSSAVVAIPKPLPVVANVPNPAPVVVVPVAVSNAEPKLPPASSVAKTSVAQNVPSSQSKKEVAKPKPQGFFATSVPPSTNEGPYPSTASAQEIEQWFRSVKGSEIAKFDERAERANKYDVAKVPSIQRVAGTDVFSVRRNITVDDRIEGCNVKQDVLIFYEDSKGNDRFEGLAVPRLREERWSSKRVLVDLAKGSVRPI